MRTLLFVALAAAALAAPASAEHSEGTGPQNDLAAGSGKLGTTTVPFPGGEIATATAFSFNAHSTVAGIHGQVNFRGAEFTGVELNAKGPVACFQVNANRAAVVFAFGPGERPFGQEFNFGLLVVEDNGPPSSTTPDRAIATGISGPEGEPVSCPAGLTEFEPLAPLVQGNVIVHDAVVADTAETSDPALSGAIATGVTGPDGATLWFCPAGLTDFAPLATLCATLIVQDVKPVLEAENIPG